MENCKKKLNFGAGNYNKIMLAVRYSFIFLFYTVGFAQPNELKEIQAQFKNERAIFLNRDKHITLFLEKDSLRATSKVSETIFFLKDQLDNSVNMRVYGNHFNEISNLKAFSKVWDKSRYKEIPLSGLTKQQDDNTAIFHDDTYFYTLSFPAGNAGNQAVWSYEEYYRDARLLSLYYFQDFLPQASGKLLIEFPATIHLSWKMYNDEQGKIKFRKYSKGKNQVYEWSVANLEEVKSETNDAGISYYVPLLVFYINSIQDGDIQKPVLSSISDLHTWYRKSLYKTKVSSSSQLTNLAKEITANAKTELEKVKQIFYWVQDNIRYVAFEEGLRGFVPHHPDYTLEKKYGDCKDMASLIVGMLNALEIKSYHTWIGTRSLSFTYSETPTPIVDNHMIATYIDRDSTIYYLDATSNFTKLGLPSSMIQGKEALLSINDTTYLLKQVPVIAASQSLQSDSVSLKLTNNTLIGNGKASFSGYQKVFASYDFNKTIKAREKEYVTAWLNKGSNKFILTNYTVQNLNDKDKPLTVHYNFQIPSYVNEVGDELYINLSLIKPYHNYLLDINRTSPLESEYTYSFKNVYELEIPDGYTIEYLPQLKNLDFKIVTYQIEYSVVGNKLIVSQSFSRNALLVFRKDIQTWNTAISNFAKEYKETIILKRKT